MNILILTATFYLSGQTTHVISLAEILQRLGHQVDLVLTTPRAQPSYSTIYANDLRDKGVHVTITRDLNRIHRLIAARQIDIIHAHAAPDFRLAQAISRFTGRPFVVTCHGLGLGDPRYTEPMADAFAVFCVGPRIAAQIPQHAAKVRVVQNAVDLKRFRPDFKKPRGRPLRIVYLGRFDPQKRAGLKALGEAVDALPMDCEFFVASTQGAQEVAGRRSQNVGWQLYPEAMTNVADVVVGTGRAVREGMASGCACLILGWSYDGMVTPDLLQVDAFPDFSGRRTYPNPPSVEAIFQDLKSLGEDRYRLRELQAFSREYAEAHFDLEASTRVIVTCYEQAIQGGVV